jgi:hypothetical protein
MLSFTFSMFTQAYLVMKISVQFSSKRNDVNTKSHICFNHMVSSTFLVNILQNALQITFRRREL